MSKKLYTTPDLMSYGDVKALTLQGGSGNADLTIGPTGITGTVVGPGNGQFSIQSTPCSCH